MKVRWTAVARLDRADIVDYIAIDNPRAALKIDEVFSEAAGKLGDFPTLGRMGKIPGIREFIPHESYRLVYEGRNWKHGMGNGARIYRPPMAADPGRLTERIASVRSTRSRALTVPPISRFSSRASHDVKRDDSLNQISRRSILTSLPRSNAPMLRPCGSGLLGSSRRSENVD